MIQSKLSEADKEWIANLIITSIQSAVKPIIDRLEAIENCPTIKNELSKNKK